MVNRADRAKQFLPFDALKGLQEELRLRERNIDIEKKKFLNDDEKYLIDAFLSTFELGESIGVEYYKNNYYIKQEGVLKKIDTIFNYILVDNEKIIIDDIINFF